MESIGNLLLSGLEKWNLTISRHQMAQFEALAEALAEGSEKMNLTKWTRTDEIVRFHFLDSLAPVAFSIVSEGRRLIDVGSGAGFPGIPIAIVRPDIQVTLCEVRQKKAQFLKEVMNKLGLENVQVLCQRAEEAGRSLEHRQAYSYAVCRAVGPLPVALEYSLPFVTVGGCTVLYSGSDIGLDRSRIQGIADLLGGKLEGFREYEVTGADRRRTLIVFRKVKETDRRYPRRAGIPAKRPLRAPLL